MGTQAREPLRVTQKKGLNLERPKAQATRLFRPDFLEPMFVVGRTKFVRVIPCAG